MENEYKFDKNLNLNLSEKNIGMNHTRISENIQYNEESVELDEYSKNIQNENNKTNLINLSNI